MAEPRTERPPPADRLRAFVASTRPAAVPGRLEPRLAGAGFVAPHWPAPWGLDAGPAEQLELDEVMRELQVPRPLNPIGIGWAGPTLLVAGTEEQQQRWLPGLLDGSELWCQLFSEPDAGSDLSSLHHDRAGATATSTSSTARRCGRRSRTSRSSGILLARTDPDAEAHRASRTSSSTCGRPASRCGRSCR